MKRLRPLGLIVEGNAIASAVLRLPSIARELGPVKSAGLQVARRISNFLHAGYAVTAYEDLQTSGLILLRVPDAAVTRVVEELCASELALGDLSFALCESWLPAETLHPLQARGASVASIVNASFTSPPYFVVEGDAGVVRQVRRMLERGDARTVELRPGAKPLYFAAQLLATAVPAPLFTAAQRALRASGLSGNPLSTFLEGMARDMFDTFAKGSRVTWGGPLTECAPETAEAHLHRLAAQNPELAAIVNQQLAWARGQIGKRSKGHSA
jgi:hypothetical protein